MGQPMKVNGHMKIEMVMVFKNGQMEVHIRASGRMIVCAEKVRRSIKMVIFIRDSLKMINIMGLECFK